MRERGLYLLDRQTPPLPKRVGRERARRHFSSLNFKPAYYLEPIFEEELNTVGPKHSRYIVLSGTLDNQNITILIDSRASGTYVHKRIANKLATFRKDKEIPYNLSSITRDSCAKVNQELRTITLEVDGYSERLSLNIVDMKYDVVLGMSWLKTHNLEIDWSKNKLQFTRCNHRSDSSRTTAFTKAI